MIANAGCLDKRENAGLDGVGEVVPSGHDAGEIGRQTGARRGLGRAWHQCGHLAGIKFA